MFQVRGGVLLLGDLNAGVSNRDNVSNANGILGENACNCNATYCLTYSIELLGITKQIFMPSTWHVRRWLYNNGLVFDVSLNI